MIGGLFPGLLVNSVNEVVISRAYYQDRLSWCIHKAKNYPQLFNFFLIATPECWIIFIFGVGYGFGLLVFILVQFDLKYKQGNLRDWHYTTFLVALPTVIGLNQRFLPTSTSLRYLYAYVAICCVLVLPVIFKQLLEQLKIPMQRYQISTIEEMCDYDFRLAGSAEVKALLPHDNRVGKDYLLCQIPV